MAPIFKSMAMMALIIFSVLASPIEQAEEFATTLETRSDFTLLEKRADFQWRFCESFVLESLALQFAMSVEG